MAQHGGKRPGAGRKPGKVGEAKRALAEMAQEHAEAAMRTLASIHADPETPAAARVSAATAILDRAYGRPPQSLDLTSSDGSMTPKPTTIRIIGPDDGSDDTAPAEAASGVHAGKG